MSRTHRCKNYLSEHGTTWDRVGRRRFGPYAEYHILIPYSVNLYK
jgi:hypothetical protein